jgi:hypothetical protein
VLGQSQQDGLELVPVQPRENLFEGGPLPNRLRLVYTGEQGGNDVLAPAAPFVRATARPFRDAGFIEGDADLVGNKLATRHLRPEYAATPGHGEYGPLPVVILAPTERLGGCSLPDQALGKFKRHRCSHHGPFASFSSWRFHRRRTKYIQRETPASLERCLRRIASCTSIRSFSGFLPFRGSSSALPRLPPRVYNLTHEQPIPHKVAESGLCRANLHNNKLGGRRQFGC